MIIFRKNALKKISSAEEIDKSIFIVNPISWVVLSTLVVIIVIFVLWSIFSTLETKVKGQGIFLPHAGSVVNILSTKPSIVKDIKFQSGDYVNKNDVIIELSSANLQEQMLISKRKLIIEQQFYEQISQDISQERRLRVDKNLEQLNYIDKNIANLKNEVVIDEDIYLKNKELYKSRIVTEGQLNALSTKLHLVKDRLNNTILKKIQLSNQDNKLIHQENTRLANIRKNISAYANALESLEIELGELIVKAPASGFITEIKVIKNTRVNANQSIANLVISKESNNILKLTQNHRLEYLAYIDLLNGKKLKKGMTVNIEVHYLDKNSYGMVKGIVKSVSKFPLSSAGIQAKLSNRNLVNLFTKRGPVYEVVVELLYHKDGLKWTSKKGNDVKYIDIGSLGYANFVISKKRPISMAIPWLKSVLK